MKHDDIDRFLSEEDSILPSSGFASSVMDAVRSEASTPPPIQFPWKRALPGLVVAAFVLVYAVFVFVVEPGFTTQGLTTQAQPQEWEPALALVLKAANHAEVGWIALALFLSFASAVLPGQLLSRKHNRHLRRHGSLRRNNSRG